MQLRHNAIEAFFSSKDAAVKKEKLKKFKAKKIEKIFKGALPHQTRTFSIRGNKQVEVPDLSQFYLLSFEKDRDVLKIIKELKEDPDVIMAEPNYTVKASSTTPNDTYFGQQWGAAKINLPQAWDLTQGSSGMIIAVIDTGVEYSHEDLSGKVILGWDYVNKDNDPKDDNGHGTHVSGIAASLTNNSKGIAGINWNAKILAIKVLDSGGNGNISDVSQGIRYAADNSAAVINLSLGDDSTSTTLQNAINYAANKGCIIVAAAGNENTSAPLYPAAYSNVLAVAATDSSDKRSVWSGSEASNYGSWIDVCAPGTTIYSTYLNDTYANESGTSMATPFTAGLAALILTVHPGWTYTQVFDRLKSTAVNIDALNPGFAGQLGSGRIDAQSALSLPSAIIISPATSEAVKGTIQINGTADSLNFSQYTISIGKGTAPSAYSTITTSTAKVSSGSLATYTTTATSDGTHTLKLSVENTDPNTTEATRSFIIDNTAPTANLTSPADGASVSGTITITGSATDANFYYYKLEYSSDGATYEQISASASPVSSGTLGTWNTAGLGGNYTLRLTAVDSAGNTSTKSISLTIDGSSASDKSSSGQSYSSPNPFNPAQQANTYISYTLSGNFNTSVFLFDITGKLIFRRNFSSGENGGKAGTNMVAWDGKDNFGGMAQNGVYLFKVVADGNILAKGKIIVLY